MVRVGEKADSKTQLVLEVISISSRSIACPHQHRPLPFKSTPVDWYHLLRVEEDADVDTIRKQYLKLALQLHPDKNKHPKAEIAFKLVSEAHACLSDAVKRRSFDSERGKIFCRHCNRIPYAASKPSCTNWSRYNNAFRAVTGNRERLKEEARVMEKCFKANAASREEFPLFNPSDYQFQGYPHHTPLFSRTPVNLWYLQGSRASSSPGNHRFRSTATPRKESPLFDPADYRHQGYPHYRTQSYQKPGAWWHCCKETS